MTVEYEKRKGMKAANNIKGKERRKRMDGVENIKETAWKGKLKKKKFMC